MLLHIHRLLLLQVNSYLTQLLHKVKLKHRLQQDLKCLFLHSHKLLKIHKIFGRTSVEQQIEIHKMLGDT
jgi:hypothetical protein